MIRSMTGFASVSREEPGLKVSVAIKSVNHRFLDVQVKAPQALGALEHRVRGLVQQHVTRGRVELSLAVEETREPAREVVLNEDILVGVYRAVEEARAKGLVSGALAVSDVLRLPQVLEVRQGAGGSSQPSVETAALVERVVSDALEALVVMRETEGRFLRVDLEQRLATLTRLVEDAEAEARAGQAQLETKLRDRLATLPADLAADPAALAQEVVRFVARSDVDEELVRLRGHVEHWRSLADGPEPCGRKLDFLVQEMNREINTIGSKAEGARATEVVVSAKAELERLREQVQNVE